MVQVGQLIGKMRWVGCSCGEIGFELESQMKRVEIHHRALDHPFDVTVSQFYPKHPLFVDCILVNEGIGNGKLNQINRH